MLLIKRLKQVITVLILVCFPVTYSAQAASVVNISIDGKERQIDPPAQLVNDRTMVPVRFIVEDPALQGQVYWDQSQQKVALDCRGHYIELFIGSPQAKVDGAAYTLDAPSLHLPGTHLCTIAVFGRKSGSPGGLESIAKAGGDSICSD
jgi:spore germination protein